VRPLPLIVLTIVLAGVASAGAQTIPRNEMAGRERERFTDSPAERFMRPGPYVAPPVIDVAPQTGKRRARHLRHKKR
jgi:hypothetical protein